MIKSGYFFTFILLCMCLFTACKTHDKITPVEASDDAGCIGNWQLTKVVVNSMEVSNTLGACLLDDVLTFGENAAFIHAIGANKCGTDEIDKEGFWEMNDDEKTLTTIVNDEIQIFTIVSLSAAKLGLMFIIPEVVDGVTVDRTYEITLIKQ